MRQRTRSTLYRIRPESQQADLNEKVGVPYSLVRQSAKHRNLQFYDSFEWHAWKKKSAVCKRGSTLSIVSLKTGKEQASSPMRKSPSSFFASDIADDAVRQHLDSFTPLRAFIRLCRAEEQVDQYRILDDNRKTVGHLEITTLTLREKNRKDYTESFLTLTPLRGYRTDSEHVAEALQKAGLLSGTTSFSYIYNQLLKAAGISPGSYRSKPSVRLSPDEPVRESARKLLLATFRIMLANEPWLSRNIDTEFLHDYRVALRRTRSILAQLKGIFPPEELSRFKQQFRELAKRTNNLRDQDVYLLEADHFGSLLPAPLREPLGLFFDDLQHAHAQELRALSRHLRTRQHAELLHTWESFLTEPCQASGEDTPNAALPTSTVAVGTIRKAWKKVIRHGRTIGPEASDEDLHSLRIDCKKLRYLLEFFSSIFPKETIGPVITHLKKLQDLLGKFVDLSVQQDYLHHRITSPGAHSQQLPAALAASLGGLVTALYHERETVRQRFHDTFRQFDSHHTATLFSALIDHYSS